jgi:hypothetical protein
MHPAARGNLTNIGYLLAAIWMFARQTRRCLLKLRKRKLGEYNVF